MANALYGKGREKFLNGDLDWAAHDIKVCLVDTGTYTVSIDTHEFLASVSSAVHGTSDNLANKTSTLGVADSDDPVFTTVSSTRPQCEALVIYRDTGASSTSPLIAYLDQATGLPISPNDADITVRWSTGANKIFKL